MKKIKYQSLEPKMKKESFGVCMILLNILIGQKQRMLLCPI